MNPLRMNPKQENPKQSLRWGWAAIALAAMCLSAVCLSGMAPSAVAADEPPPAWHAVQTGLAVRGLSGLRMHPKDGETLYAHVHGMGPARSSDQGRSWEPMLDGTQLQPGIMEHVRITVDQREPRILYLVIDGRVFRSDDAGAKFKDTTTGALSTHSWDKLKSDHLAWEVHVDDKKSALLLAGTRSDGLHHGGLFESQDGGKNWELIAGSPKPDTALDHDAFWIRRDPKTEKNITVAGKRAVWFSDDRGRKFRLNLPGIKGVRTLDVRDLSEFVAGSRELYLADERGVWQSKDAGKGWSKKPLLAGDAVTVALDPYSRKRVFAVFRDLGLVLLGKKAPKPMGLPLPTEADEKDEKDSKGDKTPAEFYPDLELTEIAFHPRDNDIVFGVSSVSGLHRSIDGGEHFAPVKPTEGKWPTVALALQTIAKTGAKTGAKAGNGAPNGNGSLMALSQEGLVFRSSDGGSWERVGRLGMQPSQLRSDPTGDAKTWLAWGRALKRSDDDGATWTTLWSDPTGNESIADVQWDAKGALHILLNRSGRVLRWGPYGPKKADEWSTVKKGPLDAQSIATSLAIDPTDDQHWVICASSVQDNWAPSDKAGGVYETWDAGTKWESLNEGLMTSKKSSSAEREERAEWNHGRLVHFLPGSNLLLYGADWRGLLIRQCLSPSADAATKKAAWGTWVPVTPAASPGRAAIAAWTTRDATAGATAGDARVMLQLRGSNNATALVEATSASLQSAWEFAHDAATPKKKKKKGDDDEPKEAPKPWVTMPDPAVVLSDVSYDPANPDRILATGPSGVLLFQAMAPVASKSDASEDEATEDEEEEEEKEGEGDAKKDDSAPDDPAPDDPKKADVDPKKADPKKPEADKPAPKKDEPSKEDAKKVPAVPAGK